MLALYRKYRPTSLAEVAAQDSVTKPLLNALKTGKISHSYLFTGPRGTGKTSVARILAHEINQFPYAVEDNYLDIIEIDAASNTGVDNIRELREKVAIAPSQGKYKVYIIDEVHMLSKSAFNALLKTLEEPPEHVVFILATTDLDKVPVTITSRSQVFHFRLATDTEMRKYLEQICQTEQLKVAPEALEILVSRGGGSFRDTLSILDQISTLVEPGQPISAELVAEALGLPLTATVNSLLTDYRAANLAGLTQKLRDFLNEGYRPEALAEACLKQIMTLANNHPEELTGLIPLLQTLPTVTAPFAEAKLLLALLPQQAALIQPPVQSPAQSLTQSPVVQPKAAAQPQIEETKTSGVTTKAPRPKTEEAKIAKIAKTETAETETKAETPQEAETTAGLDIQAFLEEIKTRNFAIYKQLTQCQLKSQNNTLHIFPARKVTKAILARQNNADFLMSFLPSGTKMLVHEIDELEKAPELQQISAIMGNVQEVNNHDEGLPF